MQLAAGQLSARPYHTAGHPSAAARVTAAPPSRRTRSRSNPAEGLASHSCEAGLSQGHPHIARYHATTCQQLPTPQRETLRSTLSTGWVYTRHSGVDDIAASCISRAATAACAEGGGTSEGGTHSVEVQPSCSQQHHHPIPPATPPPTPPYTVPAPVLGPARAAQTLRGSSGGQRASCLATQHYRRSQAEVQSQPEPAWAAHS